MSLVEAFRFEIRHIHFNAIILTLITYRFRRPPHGQREYTIETNESEGIKLGKSEAFNESDRNGET